jgi:type IV pilus assembly protein PilC
MIRESDYQPISDDNEVLTEDFFNERRQDESLPAVVREKSHNRPHRASYEDDYEAVYEEEDEDEYEDEEEDEEGGIRGLFGRIVSSKKRHGKRNETADDEEVGSGELEFLEIAEIKKPENDEDADERSLRKKRRKKNRQEEYVPYQEAPTGNWSEFKNAMVDDDYEEEDDGRSKKRGRRKEKEKDKDKEYDRDDEHRHHRHDHSDRSEEADSGEITTYTVEAATEFDNVEISEEEAGGTISFRALSKMCIEFSRIHESGVSIPGTLRIVRDQTYDDELKEALDVVYNNVKSGQELSEAMKRSGCFPFALTIAVSAAEKNDKVASLLGQFGEIYALEDKRAQKRKLSVFYPVMTVAFSIIVMMIVGLMVFPAFADMLSSVEMQLTGTASTLSEAMEAVKNFRWLFIIISVLILVGIIVFKLAVDYDVIGSRLNERSVKEGSYRREYIYSKFARYMKALLEVGVTTKDALFVTAHSFVEYPFLTEKLIEAAGAASTGSTLSNALCVFDFFPIMILQMISVGEEMGDTPKMLKYVYEYYEEAAARDEERQTAKKEPVAIIVMAVVMLVFLLCMLLPMLKLFDLVTSM